MINYLIPLISSYFSSGLFQYYFVALIILGFLATVPYIIRYVWRV